MFPLVTLFTSSIIVIARLIIAVQLTRVGRRQKLPNLLWLAAFFYLTGVSDVFAALAPFTEIRWPWLWGTGLGEVILAVFIQTTFYKDRKSPFPIFILLAVGVLAADIFDAVYLPHHSPFNWLWLIWAGSQAYKQIAGSQAIEDWIKTRYKLVIAYAAVSLAGPIWEVMALIGRFFSPEFELWLTSPNQILVAQVGILALTTVGIVMQYLAWIMPEKYRRWLDRNYQPPARKEAESNLTEEEIMRQLQA